MGVLGQGGVWLLAAASSSYPFRLLPSLTLAFSDRPCRRAFAELTAAVTTVKQPADKIAALENMTQRSAWDVRAGM